MKRLLHFLDQNLLRILVLLLLVFIPLYPKLPSIHIERTWVYIRLEDFLIATSVGVWLIQLLRKKVHIPVALAMPFGIYWICALGSLLVGLILIGPTIANFFPHVSILQYLRRLEYMILFFVAFSTITSTKILKQYLIVFCIAIAGVVIYGIGQRSYLFFWAKFPQFFEKYPFCFPSFQTGNEEFAKGIPLCLPPDGRITSTFGGHYDLAAYLVLVIPVLILLFLMLKKWYARLGMLVLSMGALMLLIFTASRVSFIAYIVGMIAALVFAKKKKFIPPILIISFSLLLLFSGSTAKRFLDTIRLTSIVTNNQGQVVGETISTLPTELQNRISKNPVVVGSAPPTQNLPAGSSFIVVPQSKAPVSTTSAVIQSKIAAEEAKRLKLKYGGVEISTVSGSFLIQKALVYDISFTTRFQAEWPNAWRAFLRFPPLGSGFSTITLATDGDYLRFMGESGFLGLLTFFSIFLILGILLYVYRHELSETDYPQAYVWGICGGVVGLLVNALFIDVFEASKVAENLWILLGIGAGVVYLFKKKKIDYIFYLKKIFSSNILIFFYLLVIIMVVFMPSINNFFVGEDFIWLRLAASSNFPDVPHYFTGISAGFYNPIAKAVMFALYTVFSLQPQGYHLFSLLTHLLITFGVFLLIAKLFKSKVWGFAAAFLFGLLPLHGENIFWISTLPVNLSVLFIVYGLYFYIKYTDAKSAISYLISLVFMILALFSNDSSLIFPLLLITYDGIFSKGRNIKSICVGYIPFFVAIAVYLLIHQHAGVPLLLGVPYTLQNILPTLGSYLALLVVVQPFVGIIIGILILGTALLTFGKRKGTDAEFRRIFVFAMSVFLIALVPYLAFGIVMPNLAYFSSIGYILLVMGALHVFLTVFLKKQSHLVLVLFVIVILLGMFYRYELNIQKNDWEKAGIITQDTLTALRIEHPQFPVHTTLQFVNVPIKQGQAWVLPVGLSDGVWFVYRDTSLNIIQSETISQAKQKKSEAQTASPYNNYIFTFDKNYTIFEVD